MTNLELPMLKPRFIMLIAVLFVCLFTPLQAQESQCDLLRKFNQIENHLDLSQNRSIATDTDHENILALASALREDHTEIILAKQLFGTKNWEDRYLNSRIFLLNIEGNSAALTRARGSLENQTLSRQLNRLNDIVSCASGTTDTDGPESPIKEGHINTSKEPANYTNALLGVPSQITQFVSKVSNYVSDNIVVISPYLIFLALFALLWLSMKYDDHKRNLRQRYQCHAEVQVMGQWNSQVGYITDISRLGLGIHLEAHLPQNMWLTIVSGEWRVRVKVMQSNEIFIGARFSKPLKSIPDFIPLSKAKKWAPNKDYAAKVKSKSENG